MRRICNKVHHLVLLMMPSLHYCIIPISQLSLYLQCSSTIIALSLDSPGICHHDPLSLVFTITFTLLISSYMHTLTTHCTFFIFQRRCFSSPQKTVPFLIKPRRHR
ncbi:hypothetical protein BC936DRAFT_149707 [Jimgerdemannia flammicorona]|uniref:Uncharacterized protein n=1 Tax=Jimgerdemannia flammicorona TaxID=994334 RepID=A0A433D096_9FUNG|nr:hypothetical protein BC936DRAFT_149707 [Jimgerdemannia flammicorona]